MPLWARKFDQGRWHQYDIINGEEISADAITGCLKTSQNTLSVWEMANENEMDDVALALVSFQPHLETIDVISLETDTMVAQGIRLEQTDGLTPVADMKHKHRDLCGLSYRSLGIVANHMVEGIRENKYRRYTKTDLKKLLKKAIATGRLDPEQLKPSVRDKINE